MRRFLEKILKETMLMNETKAVERALSMVRQEYSVMPRFGFHQPLDYMLDTLPVNFAPSIIVAGEPLPLPPVAERMGYSSDDVDYLEWGKEDKRLIEAQIGIHLGKNYELKLLDFGCSSGRVLRHFYDNMLEEKWQLFGIDIQARPIQWMRENFPDDFCVCTGSTQPHIPFPDNYFDVIYGFSVFTHIKFLWDAWLLELRRVLKPGGILIQTIHSENAWQFYHEHRNEDWVRANHSSKMLESKVMPYDFFYYGDISVSQVFWKRETAQKFWGRYFQILDILPPPKRSFQDWMVCRK